MVKNSVGIKPLIAGKAKGEVLVSDTPLSFWGGVDISNGTIIDVRHDLLGETVSGKILFIPSSRGSCSGSGIILEMIRRNNAPAAIIAVVAEPILATGSILGKELYNRFVPIYVIEESLYPQKPISGIASIVSDSLIVFD